MYLRMDFHVSLSPCWGYLDALTKQVCARPESIILTMHTQFYVTIQRAAQQCPMVHFQVCFQSGGPHDSESKFNNTKSIPSPRSRRFVGSSSCFELLRIHFPEVCPDSSLALWIVAKFYVVLVPEWSRYQDHTKIMKTNSAPYI